MNQEFIPFSPRVSCIVPCFNEDLSFLQESLASIRNQTYKDFECIVVDESTDYKTACLCKKICDLDPRFHYIHPDQRLGLAGSLNLGILKAKGEFIARFDSDDICSPTRFALQVKFLIENPEIGVVGSSMNLIDSAGQPINHRAYALNHAAIEKNFIFFNGMAHPTVMFRKSLLQISGGAYDPAFRCAEDLEFWLRLLCRNIKFANLPEPLVKYRQQSIIRNYENWRYNLKARIKNFSAPYRFKKIVGILGVALWMHLPIKPQRFLFQVIQFRKV
jgi:glycosyltransferase involved in cell wall biosynthesis